MGYEMSNKAKQGDTVKITHERSSYFGRRMVVIEWPDVAGQQATSLGEVCCDTGCLVTSGKYYVTDECYRVVVETESKSNG